MKISNVTKGFLALTIAATAACSGNFATGTGMPQQNGIPPVGTSSSMAPYDAKGNPEMVSPSPNASVSPGVANAGSYALSDAQTGFACPPTIDGYGCTLKFNLPQPTPTPSPLPKGKKRTVPTPSPTPSPTASPTENPSGSPSPKPTKTPQIPTISLKNEALPKDAPAMVHTPANSLDVVPLMMVHLTPTADFKLDGYAQAQFTLPKEQLAERGFAVQLFHANIGKKKTTYDPIWTFDKSSLKDTTLTFGFTPPKTTIEKGSTYVLVLYGDDKSKATSPAPAASASAAPTASPSAAP